MLNIYVLLAFALAHQCSSVPIISFYTFGTNQTLDKNFTRQTSQKSALEDYPGKIDLLAPCEDVQRCKVRIYIHITETRVQLIFIMLYDILIMHARLYLHDVYAQIILNDDI